MGHEAHRRGRQNYGCNLHNEILASNSYTMWLRDLGVRHFSEQTTNDPLNTNLFYGKIHFSLSAETAKFIPALDWFSASSSADTEYSQNEKVHLHSFSLLFFFMGMYI